LLVLVEVNKNIINFSTSTASSIIYKKTAKINYNNKKKRRAEEKEKE